MDRGFQPRSAEDCKASNAETGVERLAQAKVLELEPGEYVYSCPLNPTPNYRLVVKG